jgi:hypothetical protein
MQRLVDERLLANSRCTFLAISLWLCPGSRALDLRLIWYNDQQSQAFTSNRLRLIMFSDELFFA